MFNYYYFNFHTWAPFFHSLTDDFLVSLHLDYECDISPCSVDFHLFNALSLIETDILILFSLSLPGFLHDNPLDQAPFLLKSSWQRR